jgi:hypothetical protein
VAEPGSTYQEWKDELASKSKNLAGVMKNIVTVDKSNIVLIGNAAREVAELMPTVIEAVRQACVHTADHSVKSQVSISPNPHSYLNLLYPTYLLADHRSDSATSSSYGGDIEE